MGHHKVIHGFLRVMGVYLGVELRVFLAVYTVLVILVILFNYALKLGFY